MAHWLVHEPRPGETFAPVKRHWIGNDRLQAEIDRLRAIAYDPLRGNAGREQARRELEQLEMRQRAESREGRERAERRLREEGPNAGAGLERHVEQEVAAHRVVQRYEEVKRRLSANEHGALVAAAVDALRARGGGAAVTPTAVAGEMRAALVNALYAAVNAEAEPSYAPILPYWQES